MGFASFEFIRRALIKEVAKNRLIFCVVNLGLDELETSKAML